MHKATTIIAGIHVNKPKSLNPASDKRSPINATVATDCRLAHFTHKTKTSKDKDEIAVDGNKIRILGLSPPSIIQECSRIIGFTPR